MATFIFFDEFGKNLGDGTIQLGSHTFKWALTNTAPDPAANTILANITQIAAGNGYTTGGNAVPNSTWAETGAGTGVWQFGGATSDTVFTASGAGIATFRYAVLYDDTQTTPVDPLVGYVDYGSAVTVTSPNTFTIDVGAGGIFTLTVP